MVCVGRRILPKCEALGEAEACLDLLSGRGHRVYSGVTLIAASGAARRRLVETRLRFKRLSREELEAYLGSGEWRGKAGGYAIQGLAGAFVERLVGSYSNVVGLPLAEPPRCSPAKAIHPSPMGRGIGAMTANESTPPAAQRLHKRRPGLPGLRQAV